MKLLIFTLVITIQSLVAPPPPPTTAKPTTTTTTTTTVSPSNYPIITNWIKSTGTGYNSIQADVLSIYYTSTDVYISSNSIPSYSIGPWKANPNNASAQHFTVRFPLTPSAASTKTATMMGTNGLWKNGLAIYNAKDGYSYNNLGIWNRNAYYWEGISFDSCYGHPDGSGTYHHHVNPSCMYTPSSSSHSPIIGWAYDGYPIYGPYGYSTATSSSSSIKRITTSYHTRSITDRTTLPDGTVLNSTSVGPVINGTYPLGSYLEDYEYTSGYGDLDQYNGRWCVTPEYPSGTYAYFIPVDSSLTPQYPYTIGPYFYGTLNAPATNFTVPASATKYFSYI